MAMLVYWRISSFCNSFSPSWCRKQGGGSQGQRCQGAKLEDERPQMYRCHEAVDPKIIQEMVILCHIYIVGNPLVWR